MRKMVFIIGLWLAVFGAPAAADDWVRPAPTGHHSGGFGDIAEIFPVRSRQNPSDRQLCYRYEVGHPGSDGALAARLVWQGPLVNPTAPVTSAPPRLPMSSPPAPALALDLGSDKL